MIETFFYCWLSMFPKLEIIKMNWNYRSALQTFKKQPYVYGYRIRLSLMKHHFSKRLLRTYMNFSLRRTQQEVSTIKSLTIDSIITNPFLSKYRYTCLYALCRFLKPRMVVETGVGMGASSYFILQALYDNGCGELYSVDSPESIYSSDAGIEINESAYTAQGNDPGYLVPDFLRKHWTLILGKSEEKLPSLCEQLGTIDLFFHDSEHTYENMLGEYETVWRYIRHKGFLASHDIDWNNAFHDFSEKHSCAPSIAKNGFGLIIRQCE
ncbi:MAG: class I SAM-dependent methyltransferase [Candidatus Bathyarchaeota archaeon]